MPTLAPMDILATGLLLRGTTSVSETIPLAVTPRKLAIGESDIFFARQLRLSLKLSISCLALYIFYMPTCNFLVCLFPSVTPFALFAHWQIYTHLGLDSSSDAHCCSAIDHGSLWWEDQKRTPASAFVNECAKVQDVTLSAACWNSSREQNLEMYATSYMLLHLFDVLALRYNQGVLSALS